MNKMRNRESIERKEVDLRENWRMLGLKIIDQMMRDSDSFWFKTSAQKWRLPGVQTDAPAVDLSIIRFKL